MIRRRPGLALPVLLLLLFGFGACGAGAEETGITMDTTCREYLGFGDDERGIAVRTLGAEVGWAQAGNPLSRLSFDAHCSQRLDQTMATALGLFAN